MYRVIPALDLISRYPFVGQRKIQGGAAMTKPIEAFQRYLRMPPSIASDEHGRADDSSVPTARHRKMPYALCETIRCDIRIETLESVAPESRVQLNVVPLIDQAGDLVDDERLRRKGVEKKCHLHRSGQDHAFWCDELLVSILFSKRLRPSRNPLQ